MYIWVVFFDLNCSSVGDYLDVLLLNDFFMCLRPVFDSTTVFVSVAKAYDEQVYRATKR